MIENEEVPDPGDSTLLAQLVSSQHTCCSAKQYVHMYTVVVGIGCNFSIDFVSVHNSHIRRPSQCWSVWANIKLKDHIPLVQILPTYGNIMTFTTKFLSLVHVICSDGSGVSFKMAQPLAKRATMFGCPLRPIAVCGH